MKRIVNKYHNITNMRNQSLFLLELIFLLIFLAFILPLTNLGLNYTIQLWGQSYITFENVLSYLSFPPALLFLMLIIVLISYFLLYQQITMICCCNSCKGGQKPKLLHIMLVGLLKTKRCFRTHYIAFPFFSIFLFVMMNLPVLICITFMVKISFLGNADLGFVKVLLVLIYILIAMVAFRGMFVVHFLVNERQNFLNAMELSKSMLQRRSLKAFRELLFGNLVLTMASLIIYYTVMMLTVLFIFFSVDKSMVITEFLSVYPRICYLLLILFQIVIYIRNLDITTRLFTRYHEEVFGGTPADHMTRLEDDELGMLKNHRLSLNSFLVFVIIAGLTNSYMTVRSDSLYLKNALRGIQVSSHRGNSHVAPENTLPALENAILAGSDYAEIDVRESKDGVLVLMHDGSLRRTAGVNKKLESLNLKELSKLDAGSWFSQDFTMTRIPTLEEAILLCKGKIKLNIEVKAGQKDPEFEEDLVNLINKYDFEHQCLISSFDYDSLVKIKQQNSNLRTGLIISAAYGNYYDKGAVDFFSIRSNHITRQVVENAHKAGKEVHAWTVNTVSEIERMKSIGVDCIITDNPSLVKKVLFEDNTGMTFIDLLNQLLSTS